MLTRRWHVLALLLFTRGSMGFQFQSVAAFAPLLSRDLALTPAQIGVLIGLYMLPGILVAIPAALVGQWLGGKRTVLLALTLMAVSGFALAAAGFAEAPAGFAESSAGFAGAAGTGFALAAVARLLGGTGMALLNVLVTKMVADRFEGRETATAMGLLLAVWPAGMALALATLGGLATVLSWQVSAAVTGVWPLAALALVALLYRDVPHATGAGHPPALRGVLSLRMFGLSSAAGWAWTLYNCGLIALISFGPTVLVARGATLAHAGLISSLITWGMMIGTPTGGLLTDATRRPVRIVVFACVSGALGVGAILLGSSAVHFLLMGFCIGLPTGPIMAMLGQALPARERGLGYGILLSWYYLGLGAVPAVAGWVQQSIGSPLAIVPLSAALILAALLPYAGFHQLKRLGSGGSRR